MSRLRYGRVRIAPEIVLTKKQWLLFAALDTRRGELVDDDALIAAVWPGQAPREGDYNRLTVLLHSLRVALAASPWRIERGRRRGYRLCREVNKPKGPAGGNIVVFPPSTSPDGLDQERHMVFAAGEWRPLSPTLWRIFQTMRGRHGPVRVDALLADGSSLSLGRETVRQLRKQLDGSPYRIITHRHLTAAYELVIS